MPYPSGIKLDALVPVEIMSVYNLHTAKLPSRMAYFTPDTADALAKSAEDYSTNLGGTLYLSDGFRGEYAQGCAYLDYLAGHHMTAQMNDFLADHPEFVGYTPRPKMAYSPPPGGSMHESGRAIDIELDPNWSKTSPEVLRETLEKHGWVPIADLGQSEAWHMEFRGPFQAVYDSTLPETGDHKQAYRAMTEAAIADIKEA